MDKEQVVFVTPDGTPTGETAPKLAAHTLHTRLHLAFSCYVFNEKGQLLVTQRAHKKKVWPGVWTNSVCGHPMQGEDMVDAIRRRLEYELGMKAEDFQLILPDYQYKTPPFKGIIEHEFCPVYITKATSEPVPNPDEVAAFRWVEWDSLVGQFASDQKDTWSWWVKDQAKRLDNNQVFRSVLT